VEYKKLVDLLYSIYVTPGEIEQYVLIKVKINKIARAIVGHFLAARSDFSTAEDEIKLRKYVLNPNIKPPKNCSLLYYTYIYNTIMIVRNVVPKNIRKTNYEVPSCLINCISSFPLSFILAIDCENKCGLYDLFELCTENIDDEVEIKIDLLSYLYPDHKRIRAAYWPCNVSDDETGTDMMMTTTSSQRDSVFSGIRKNLKEKKPITIKRDKTK
jgi:hypothetical protein